ncbi:T9SS type A sorting domain-containing protein [uncultured Algibacter sp.]|uniref:T9SS type A sorting domain-containing protein n=1 Tax=uncultured Algibacter sp. TaxID=298659 RepID=UPI00321665B0
MSLSKSFLITACTSFLFLVNSYSQTGPGGVAQTNGSSRLFLWLKSDVGVYENTGTDLAETGDPVNQWNDISGYDRHILQTTIGERPTYTTGVLNGEPVLRFATNDNLGPLSFNGFSNDYSIFIVSYTSGNTQDFLSFSFPGGPGSLHGILLEGTSFGRLRFLHRNPTGVSGGNSITAGSTRSTTTSQILSFTRGRLAGSSGNHQFWINGADNQSIVASDVNFTGSGNLLLGKLSPTQPQRYLNGDMAEVIVIGKEVKLAERIIIENYLSAKFNISLGANDLYTQDNTANGDFDHHVAGIGQASDGTNHTRSRGTGTVRIDNASSLSNNDFLIWGEETKTPTYDFSTNTTNYTEQLNSTWRVSKINDLGTVRVRFILDNYDLTGKQACQPLQLVVDNDSDFSSPTNIYDLTFNGAETRATADNVVFNDGDYFTLRYVDEIVWDGTTYFNGSGVANAPDNTDSCLKLTVKPGATGILTADAHVREVEVETGAILNVSDGILLETENQVDINGVIDLLGEAQLIQNHNLITSNSGTGFLIKRQQGVGNLFNYNYWSAPVNNGGFWQIANLEDVNGVVNFTPALDANPATAPITLSSEWLYTYNDISNTYALWQQINNTTNLSPGIGYTMKGSGAAGLQEYIFRGTPNDGNYSYSVNAGDDFLVGNPYPSALSANQFINDNLLVIDGSLRFWEQFATNNSHILREYEGGYAVYNLMMPLPAVADASGLTSGNGTTSNAAPTPNVPVGQGFFVTIDNSGSLVFNNQQRAFARESLNESIFYKTSNKLKKVSNIDSRTKIWFSFVEPGNRKKIIGLGYDEDNATYNYDNGYDSKVSESDILRNDLHWVLDDKKLAIQALPSINIEDELPLTMEITDSGIYKFGIDKSSNLPDNINIYLKDKTTGLNHNLITLDEAEVFINTNDDKQRFSIVFKAENVLDVDDINKTNFKLAYNNQSKDVLLYGIEDLNKIQSISIHNMLGQNMLDLKSIKSKTINVSNISNGTYIVKVNLKNNTTLKPYKFVKY